MFKLIHVHTNSRDLSWTNKEYQKLLAKGEIRYPENYKQTLVVFGFIKITLN